MATITGSSGSNWSGISFPALDLGGDFATLAARFSSAYNAFVNFQFSVISASTSQLKVHLNAFGVEGVLTLRGSGFDSAPVITSITFNKDGSDELVKLTGRIDGRGSESLTSFTYVSPDGEYTVSAAGSFSLNPASTSISGRASSVTIVDDSGSKIVFTGSATVSGSGSGATLSGNISAIAISGAGGSATITGLSLPYGAVNGIDSPADLLALAPLLAGNDKITFSSSIGIALDGGAGNDTLTGGGFADTLIGGAGDDTYTVTVLGQDTLSEAAGQGSDTVRLAFNVAAPTIIEVATFDQIENIEAAGTGAFHLTGDGAGNRLTGNASGNTLTGGGGDDVLDGRGGVDTMTGGEGNDLYVLDRALDVFTEETGQGSDTVRIAYNVASATTIDLAVLYGGNVESVQVTGTGVFRLFGNGEDNALAGNASANVLDGRLGDDTLTGGAGNDSYFVDSEADVIVEAAGGGTDIVRSSGSYALSANVEHLILLGAGQATGNASHNAITGSDGADTLVGGAGNDTLRGGLGNDTYVIGVGTDTIIDSGGHELVQSSASLSIAALLAFEDIELTGSANVNAVGNSGQNVLTGNEGNNILDGGAGADTMAGGLGNDIFVVRSLADDTVLEALDEGSDTVRVAFNTAGALAIDLGDFENVENAQIFGTGAFHLTGTDAANSLIGNASANTLTGAGGDDILDGKAGVDTMLGGLGNDTYFIDRVSDIVTEADGEGSDTLVVAFNVSSATTISLVANVEHATVNGTGAFRVIGNAADNVLIGNASANRLTGAEGNDTLDGKGGVDTLVGGAGNDRLIVGSLADVIDESGGGTDTVHLAFNVSATTATTIDLATRYGGFVEHVGLVGNGRFNLLGNGANNLLVGNAASNVLNGRAGADTMQGGAGNDTYFVDHVDDVISELSGGADAISANVDAMLASLGGGDLVINLATDWTGIERITLTGTGPAAVIGGLGADSITGNAGANTLDGGGGADTLVGGLGNDRYIITSDSDVIIEAAGAGTDTVVSNLFSYTLGANLENLELVAGGTHGFGNAGSNVISGMGNGSNSLSGLGGDDTIAGGAGVDVLDGGVGNDVLDGGADNDTLQGADGNDALAGGGGDDLLDGAAGNDTLQGDAGNDTLQGGTGADSMTGGAGDDRYLVDDLDDAADESADGSDGEDTVVASVSYTLGAGIEHLEVTSGAAATGNALDNTITGNSADNTLDGGAGSDTLTGGGGNDRYLVDDAGDEIDETAPGSGGTDLVVSSAASFTLSTDIEDLELAAGSADLSGTGNDLANHITGNDGDNLLAGGGGNDTLVGGSGNDTLEGGTGSDSLVGGTGNDLYVFAAVPPPGTSIELTGDLEKTFTDANDFGDGKIFVQAVDLNNDGLVDTLHLGHQGSSLFSLFEFSTRHLDGNLVPGLYTDAERYPFDSPGHPGIGISVEGWGPNTLTGEFAVELAEFDYSGASPMAEVVLLTFELHPEGGSGTIFGTVSINLSGEPMSDQIVEANGGGIDTVQSGRSFELPANVEHLTLTGSDHIDGTGNALHNEITGNDGDNALDGAAGNDTLIGGAGNDTLAGDEGHDWLAGGAGDDLYIVTDAIALPSAVLVMNGNSFTLNGSRFFTPEDGPFVPTLQDRDEDGLIDRLRIFFANEDVEHRWDLIWSTPLDGNLVPGYYPEAYRSPFLAVPDHPAFDLSGEGRGSNASVSEFRVIAADFDYSGDAPELVSLSIQFEHRSENFPEAVFGTLNINHAGVLHDNVYEAPDAGIDTVQASISYALTGNVENLVLTGGNAVDGWGNTLANNLTGNGASNRLEGHGGNDSLTGGGGADSFVFAAALDAATNVDTISDFASALDKLVLDDAIFAALGAGALDANALASGAGMVAAADATDRIVYDSTTGDLYYDSDGVGGAASVKFATLTGAPTLAATDFEVV